MTLFDSIFIGSVIVPIALLIVEILWKVFTNHKYSTALIIVTAFFLVVLIVGMMVLANHMGWESSILQRCDFQQAANVIETNPSSNSYVTIDTTQPINAESPTPAVDDSAYMYTYTNSPTLTAKSITTSEDPTPIKITPPPTQNSATAVPSSDGGANTASHIKQQLSREEIIEIYPSFDPSNLYPLTTDAFSLSVSKLALNISIPDDHTLDNTIGVFPTAEAPVIVALYNYYDGSLVELKETDFVNDVSFDSLKDGIYFFIVYCDGYKTGYSHAPFLIINDVNKERDVLPWSICIEKNNSTYSDTFLIQIKNGGSPIKGKEIIVNVLEGSEANCISGYPFTTDEKGYLQMWYSINGIEYYSLAYFSLLFGCNLQIEIEDENVFCDVQASDSGIWIADIGD